MYIGSRFQDLTEKGLFVYCKEILGVHIGENNLEFASLRKKFSSWERFYPAFIPEVTGRNGMERLESLLTSLKPKRTRRICISIPRSRYFLRELSFPGLTLQEAEGSARMAVGMHSHLPKEEIYFDVWPLAQNGQSRVLLAYAKRSYIDPILEIVRRSGHRRSMHCICPSGLGTDIFLRMSRQIKFPALSLHQEEKEYVINLHGLTEWEGSHLVRQEGDFLNIQKILEMLPPRFRHVENIFRIGNLAPELSSMEIADPCSKLEELKVFCAKGEIDGGLTACFTGTSSFPQISFQDSPRKRPLFLRINTFQWAAAALAAAILLVTGLKAIKLGQISTAYSKNQKQLQQLEKQYQPLRKIEEKIERIKKLEKDMDDFIHERPRVLKILKALADTTPLEAWIRSCTIRGGIVRVSAEGGSAVDTMEKWRKNPLFSEVKLVSPVTKNRQQQERYTVELKLRRQNSSKK
ncbi:MAG: hypothetical protein DSZ23_05665 [Thermodesulfatator sp.]|nr:MAG: hypothetical protein DSZ23_05665 [Thermodesulfatator sp.]